MIHLTTRVEWKVTIVKNKLKLYTGRCGTFVVGMGCMEYIRLECKREEGKKKYFRK